MYTRSTKSSGKVEEAWLECSTPTDAQAVVDKIDSKIGRAQVWLAPAEFALNITVLLDRYAVSDHVDWVVSQLRPHLGWHTKHTLNHTLSAMSIAWRMTPGSVYRKAIVNLCESVLTDNVDTNCAIDDLILPLPPMHAHCDLQVPLQVLRWIHDCAHHDTELLDKVSVGIQSVIDRWSGQDQNDEQHLSKRQRI